jgi:hypothetical protein
VRKTLKAKRSRKPEVLMNTEFRYKGPRREVGFLYVGRDWVFLAIVIAFGIFFLGMIVATAGGALNGQGLVEALLDFVKSWRVLKGL